MFVDAYYNQHKDIVNVVERVDGQRVYKTFPAKHVFYYSHPSGSHRSIFGDSCRKFETKDAKKFKRELRQIKADPRKKIFESDIRQTFRILADNYKGAASPNLNICFLDIETDWCPERLFAPTDDPFNAVTAITFYLTSVGRLITLVLCPPTVGREEGEEIASRFDDTILFFDEVEMLQAFLLLIDDVDLFSGWNSEGYDIPYLVNRITRVMGADATRDLCLWNQKPRPREYSRFGKTEITYDLVGRVHLDYMQLYKKHVTQQQHSYALDFIGDLEVGESKVPYDGSLDDLYKKEFPKFIEYSRQDVMLLVKIDQKRKYIELHNQVAHGNCVDFKTTMGSVSLVETAIINEMHEMGLVVPDKKATDEYLDDIEVSFDEDGNLIQTGKSERNPVVGAYVADPKKGLHDYVGAIDLNSLYPSVLRALNMSPETIFAQVRLDETERVIAERVAKLPKTKRAEAWNGVFHCFEYGHMLDRDEELLTVDFEDGSTRQMMGHELYDMIFAPNSGLCITANGTIFRTDIEGIIPALLARWYADRKKMQGLSRAFANIAAGDGRKGFKFDADLIEIAGHLIESDGNDWYRLTGDNCVAPMKALSELYDQRQLARKILLNSLYGALLNEALRFYDPRVGQSVTLTGRAIAKHMNSKTNEVATGVYDYKGEAIIYADTDSCYFSVAKLLSTMPERYTGFEPTRDNYIKLYDGFAQIVNDSFAEFMDRSFNTGLERGAIIAAGREIVASRALFIKKKKYAALIYDNEGTRLDVDGKPGKLKAMGLDLKRADTPKIMQKFMSRILVDLLEGASKEDIFSQIYDFRKEFKGVEPWAKGSPKAVNNLTEYTERHTRSQSLTVDGKRRITDEAKVNLPQQVRASINWNNLCEYYNDRYATRLTDGSRTIVCRLRKNSLGIDSIAYPFDEHYLPDWLKELPFDEDRMEDIIIDKKLNNLLGVLDWNFDETKEKEGLEEFSFF